MTIQHLTASDYKTMPWSNGRGVTLEMIRCENKQSELLWRLSIATVTEDGPFSMFPGIERNLTVLSGQGFELVEEESGIILHAELLKPLAFAGDTPLYAKKVRGPCQDFNVMTSGALPKPRVWIEKRAANLGITKGEWLIVFALDVSIIQAGDDTINMKGHELLICERSVRLEDGAVICLVLDERYRKK